MSFTVGFLVARWLVRKCILGSGCREGGGRRKNGGGRGDERTRVTWRKHTHTQWDQIQLYPEEESVVLMEYCTSKKYCCFTVTATLDAFYLFACSTGGALKQSLMATTNIHLIFLILVSEYQKWCSDILKMSSPTVFFCLTNSPKAKYIQFKTI